MRRFSIQRADERLILERRRASHLPSLAALLLLSTALVAACLAHPLGRPLAGRWQEFFSVQALVCLAFTIPGLSGLRRLEIVFDRRIGVVLINGRVFLSLCELQSIHLDRGSQGTLILSLRARSGAGTEVGREGVFGSSRRELEELARRVAEFTGSDLVTPGRFVAGTGAPSGGGAPWPDPETVGRIDGNLVAALSEEPGRILPAVTQTDLTEFEFSEELKKYQFRDWRFEPMFLSAGQPNVPGVDDARGAAYRSFGVRIWYVADDNRFPGVGRQITLHINRFFDPGQAVRNKDGWAAWVRAWLWGHVRWVLDHEAREQFFYDGGLPFDPHAATGGTLAVPQSPVSAPSDTEVAKPAPGAAQHALPPTPHGACLRRLRKAVWSSAGGGRG